MGFVRSTDNDKEIKVKVSKTMTSVKTPVTSRGAILGERYILVHLFNTQKQCGIIYHKFCVTGSLI